jgi:septation ring formation regulator EzrA
MLYRLRKFFREIMHQETEVDHSLEKLPPRIQIEIQRAAERLARLLQMEMLQEQLDKTQHVAEEAHRMSEQINQELTQLRNGLLELTERYTELLGKFSALEKEIKSLRNKAG